MPVHYTVDHRRQRVHAVASGNLGLSDLGTYIASRVKDGVYDYDQLIDLSGAHVEVVSQEVLQLVRQARVNLSERPIPFTAIVAHEGTATYGTARQLATIFGFDGATVHIVDTVDDATQWLDQMRKAADRERQTTRDGA